ncbi:hypothetical protein GPECTOR_25g382 [Gonium pectorale]|uniref:C2 domain-containing protein n=1 Tax=Gonium pectorale TaxID=33097 RepID=A0A150GG34_GONPE|nr:hypothetical protein GPECTOR_25g382 [Gonium pectorale]|eukprot:KXZ48798.1 hypothetical protein GPECTOR_25g382 [Gonium pectorale]
MALEAGTLRVTLQYAKGIKDCDWFGRQDPYAKLRVGSQEVRSRMVRDGGRNPVWDETFDFNVINENTLEITIMDEDTVVRDDLIGTCSVSLARVREQGVDRVQAPLTAGKKAQRQEGFVALALSFTPNSRLRPGAAGYGAYGAPPYGAPAPAYGYPPAMAPCASCGHGAAAAAPYYAPPPPQAYAQPPYGHAATFAYGSTSYAPPPPPSAPSAPSAPPAPPLAPPPYGAQAQSSYYPPPPSYYPVAPTPSYGAPYAAPVPYYRS